MDVDIHNRDLLVSHIDQLGAELREPRPARGLDARRARLRQAAEDAAATLHLGSGTEVLQKVQDELREHGEAGASAADRRDNFVASHPLTAGIQTALERRYHPSCIDRLLRLVNVQPKSQQDPRWIVDIGTELLERLARGCHEFNRRPAEYEIAADARLVVVGDWGTGLDSAFRVAKNMKQAVAEALADDRQVHVIHLGDVYYAGEEHEYRQNVLAKEAWPVTVSEARGHLATSWALNGNHDMFSGGHHYFDTMLRDERFSLQCSADGQPTSFFRLSSPHWNIVGLDTAWSPDILAMGRQAVLEDPQADFLSGIVSADRERKQLLLSHHQLMSYYELSRIGQTLDAKLKRVFDDRAVNAWFWGHEHRCMGFTADSRVESPRCIGHGGIPTPYASTSFPIPAPPPPSPGSPPQSKVLWQEESDPPSRKDGQEWARCGFVVMDLHDKEISVRYLDDSQGSVTSIRHMSSAGSPVGLEEVIR